MLDVANAAMYLSPEYRDAVDAYFASSPGPASWKLQEFTKYVPRQALTRFLLRDQMFRQVLNIQGSIIEGGVLGGWGLMAWAQLSAIYEHLNYQRKIIGFDTFEGFPSLTETDAGGTSPHLFEGGLFMNSYDDLQEAVRLYDMNRFLGDEPKVELVKGDACETIPQYFREHPETIISLVYLDFDLEAPTRVALEHIVPRMPKGGLVAFDELNDPGWPGETVALLETLDIRNLCIKRFTYDTKICYVVLD